MPRFVETYNHNHALAVMLELRADDDFTLQTPEFRSLATDLALHVAASDPQATAYGQQILSLLNQRFAKNQEITVRERIEHAESTLHANIEVVRYVRYDARG